jgi:hypothetical protein
MHAHHSRIQGTSATVVPFPTPIRCYPNDIAVSRRTGALYVSCVSVQDTPPSHGPIIAIDIAGAAYVMDAAGKCSQAGRLSLNDHPCILYATYGSSLIAYNSTLQSNMRISAAGDDGSTHGGFAWTATWIAIVAGGGVGLLLVVGASVVAYSYHRRRLNVVKIHSSGVALQQQQRQQQQQSSTYGLHTGGAPVITHVGYGNPTSTHYSTGS